MTYSQGPTQQPQWQQQATQNNGAASKLKFSTDGQMLALGLFGLAVLMFLLRLANWYVLKIDDGSEAGKLGLRGNGNLKIEFNEDGESFRMGLEIFKFVGNYSFAAILAVLVAAALSLSLLYRRIAFIIAAVALGTYVILPTLQFLILLIFGNSDADAKLRPGFGLIVMWVLVLIGIGLAVWLQTLTKKANQPQQQFAYAPQGQNAAWGQPEQQGQNGAWGQPEQQGQQNAWQQPQPEPQSQPEQAAQPEEPEQPAQNPWQQPEPQAEQTTAFESPATETQPAPEEKSNPWAELDEDPKDSTNRNPWA